MRPCLFCGTDHSNDFKHSWLARSIEEGFLGCVARLVRTSERGRKSRATSLGMTTVAIESSERQEDMTLSAMLTILGAALIVD
jgi:hypothetical protein